ncbi:FtsX-like permease family protein [Methanobrevibacter sp.]|uniref:FtsX-like permease family protein n=1 Tax=Methanobrevibacter sp. TaxID=66852 RepID=UPI00345B73F9
MHDFFILSNFTLEVERDMATLKVLGFQLSDLRKLFITQYLGISIIGFLIEIPIGYYVLESIRSNGQTILSDRLFSNHHINKLCNNNNRICNR